MEEKEQEINDEEYEMKEGYCKIENKMTMFIPTESPKGFFICSSCQFRTDKILKPPKTQTPYTDIFNENEILIRSK